MKYFALVACLDGKLLHVLVALIEHVAGWKFGGTIACARQNDPGSVIKNQKDFWNYMDAMPPRGLSSQGKGHGCCCGCGYGGEARRGGHLRRLPMPACQGRNVLCF